ncbi:bifunctional pyr operon transcriptional regulator/uracil phosphoribosyltransferase PyrR [Niveibacterium umoris]|uniref:Pyrimidine operon attenuation protein/uracil phosphoribosyltransferase n=1 Tax=Niveibacterium umoris TaxID=1193620 RepID=A0A840BNI4_9RHOO|nr:bifunctional pyr operon transcriptional regulator/uracil phosphoribosyltransferase PyrR [Niveibacterium umoris]MBB4013222.1 pyrimidine operon attenuation protein/uracil phosphoribosyltransferase [Niveibacterium umoris]
MHLPDVESLIADLVTQIRPHLTPATGMVGIHTGGVWLAERLHAALGIATPLGVMDVSFYRDDYSAKGLHPSPRKTDIRFDVDGAPIIVVDDVLYTGRTTRAALNELFDYGRPARVDLCVLADRGGRELPVAARFCGITLQAPLSARDRLQLEKAEDGALTLRLAHA